MDEQQVGRDFPPPTGNHHVYSNVMKACPWLRTATDAMIPLCSSPFYKSVWKPPIIGPSNMAFCVHWIS